MTVKEQLLYEIGDPDNYLSPDVVVSFLTLAVEDLGHDRVRVSSATGKPRPNSYKVSATYRDGYRSAGTLTIIGRNSEAKARRVGEFVLQQVRDAGFTLRDSIIECLGHRAVAVATKTSTEEVFGETVLRVAVEAESREAVERFSCELMPYITAGPQGTTGYAVGRPRVHPVFRYWPCMIGRDAVAAQVELLSSPAGAPGAIPKAVHVSAMTPSSVHALQPAHATAGSSDASYPTHLYDIACARSGDKGSSANIGVIARQAASWEFLRTWLSADRVAEFFEPLGVESVDRFELPNLHAINFVLPDVLRRNLQTDAQGKALGQMLLELKLPAVLKHKQRNE
jgi:hypothetical protein